jgi:heptaprenylglyceryl phosphate synthase
MRYVTIGRYQFSIVLIVIAVIASPLAFAATYYIWNTKTVPFTVDEPLSVIEFPSSLHFHPGQNATLDITIGNSANINYYVKLNVTLSDTQYQQLYVQVSEETYTIIPGDNTISAWISISGDAPQSQQQLTVDFLRV